MAVRARVAGAAVVREPSELEALLLLHIRAAGLPVPEREVRFHPTRRWRFDFAWAEQGIAAEVDGSTWAQGRHTRGAGFEADCEKCNEATIIGWRVLRFTRKQITDRYAVDALARALAGEGE